MIMKNINMINSLNNNNLDKGIFRNLFLSTFLDTDPLEYEIITPEIAKYYILYYKSSYSIEYLLDEYKSVLKAFIKFMVLKNTFTAIDIFNELNINRSRNNINRNEYLLKSIDRLNNTDNISKNEIEECLDRTRLEFYIYTKKMNTLNNRNFKCDLSTKDKFIITKELLKRIDRFEEDYRSEDEIKINNRDNFNYLITLLKVYIIFTYNFINRNDLFKRIDNKKQEILRKIGKIGYLIGYNDLGNLLLSYEII